MILVTHENGWTMHLRKEFADDPEEIEKVREVLRKIGEIKIDGGNKE